MLKRESLASQYNDTFERVHFDEALSSSKYTVEMCQFTRIVNKSPERVVLAKVIWSEWGPGTIRPALIHLESRWRIDHSAITGLEARAASSTSLAARAFLIGSSTPLLLNSTINLNYQMVFFRTKLPNFNLNYQTEFRFVLNQCIPLCDF